MASNSKRRKILTLSIAALLVVAAGVAIMLFRSRDDTKRILVVLKTLDNPYYVDMKLGAERAAAELGPGVKAIIKAGNAEDDVQGQTALIYGHLDANSVDAISIAPASSTAMIPVIRRANSMSVPVIVLDTRLDAKALDDHGARYNAFIGSDNERGGELAAKFIGKKLGNVNKSVLLLEGVPTQETAITRATGFKRVQQAEFASWNVVAKTANWNRQQARQVMDTIIATQGIPAAVFACNDEMALGVVGALESAGIARAQWPPIVGFDATSEALAAVKDGRMSATVQQRPDRMGRSAVELAVEILNGGSPLRDNKIPVELIEQ